MSDVLGLDRQLHEAYHALLHDRARTPAELADRLGIPRVRAEETVDRLAAAGLAAPSTDEPRQVVPVDPRRSFGPLLARRQARLVAQQHELARTQEAVAALSAAFTANDSGRSAPPELSRGVDAVRVRIQDMLEASQATVVCFVGPEARTLALDIQGDAIRRAVARGVSIRAMYAAPLLTDGEIAAHARWLDSVGACAKTTPSLPTAMMVVDRCIALVPADSDTATAVVVHNRALAHALSLLFDQAWGEAKTSAGVPQTGATNEPSQQERDLLRLLGRGLTDASAARQLGVSLRTVRRMMAEIMARLEARSRFAAGIRAAERGWTGPELPVRPRRAPRVRPRRSSAGRSAAVAAHDPQRSAS